MRVLAVGRMRGTPEAELFSRYAARLRPRLSLNEIPDGHGAPAERKRREGAALLAAIPPGALAVALDTGGAALNSPDLARLLGSWRDAGRLPCFLIGGPDGLEAQVLAGATRVVSLGPMTWPHLLARAMLAEQLWRATAILDGHPYHRAGRPGGSPSSR